MKRNYNTTLRKTMWLRLISRKLFSGTYTGREKKIIYEVKSLNCKEVHLHLWPRKYIYIFNWSEMFLLEIKVNWPTLNRLLSNDRPEILIERREWRLYKFIGAKTPNGDGLRPKFSQLVVCDLNQPIKSKFLAQL